MILYPPKNKTRLAEISKMADAWQEKQRIKKMVIDTIVEMYCLYQDEEFYTEYENFHQDLERAMDAARIAVSIYNEL